MKALGRAALTICVAACSVPDLDLDGLPCPCVGGYVCVDDACVRESDVPDASTDTGVDTGMVTMLDSGPFDADVQDSEAGDADAEANRCGLYCQDFETDIWTLEASATSRASFAMETNTSYQGEAAARFSVTAHPQTRNALFSRLIGTATTSAVHLRAWVYVEAALTEARLLQLAVGGADISASFQEGRARLQVEGTLGEEDSGWTTSTPLPTNEWFCLRLSVLSEGMTTTVRGQANALDAWLLSSVTIPVTGEPVSAKAGIIQTPTRTEGSVLIDDLIVSDAELPCDATF